MEFVGAQVGPTTYTKEFDVKKCFPNITNFQCIIVCSGTYGGKPGKKLI